MKLRTKFLIVFSFECMAFALLVFMVFLTFRRPLIHASGWRVEAGTHSGNPLPVKAYRLLGCDMPLYLFINDRKWDEQFMVFIYNNDAHVAMPNSVFTFPFLNAGANSYAGYGVNILVNCKEPIRWFISCVDESVVFSNRNYFVSVSKKELP